MTSAAEVIESVLQHNYDAGKAHDYYMRTRHLKGRHKGVAKPTALPPTQAGYPGQPHKLGTPMLEDMSPYASPGGSKKLTSYDPGSHGLGRATFADGFVYDGKVGWIKPQAGLQRVNAAQATLDRARKTLSKVPAKNRKMFEARVARSQARLNKIKASTKSRENQ